MWVFPACLFAGFFQLPATAFSSFTLVDKYLNGYELRIAKVEEWYPCIKQCQEEPFCVSYNYYETVCQLNRHGFEDQCQAEQELSRKNGWIYHQIREVKSTKRVREGSCSCNCGTPSQCFVEPGYGTVPEKSGTSCREILEKSGSASDGPYYLRSSSSRVFCHMTSIPECGNEAGWTLVMKINGSEETFHHDSGYWNEPKEYQPENGENLDEKETKLSTFNSVVFEKICMGMKTHSSSIHWLMKGFSSGKYLFRLFKDNRAIQFHYNGTVWSGLLNGTTLKDEIIDGFNAEPRDNRDGVRVRLGAIASESGNTWTSFIGFGASTDGDRSIMHQGVTCGNVNGQRFISAFGYILVK